MPKKQCPNCNTVVAMRYTPQSKREYCPNCRVVQDDWDRNELML